VGLIARNTETAGIPTLSMGSALDITKAVNPPRAAFLDFPLGHTTGEPHQPELQRDIMLQALEGFTSLTEPGAIKMLPFRWSQGDEWKETASNDGDTRTERHDTPQYQLEEDRILAEQNNPEVCEVCEVSA
jgi:hypothetical protein